MHIRLNAAAETFHKRKKHEITALNDSLNDRSIRPRFDINYFLRRKENVEETFPWEDESAQKNIQ